MLIQLCHLPWLGIPILRISLFSFGHTGKYIIHIVKEWTDYFNWKNKYIWYPIYIDLFNSFVARLRPTNAHLLVERSSDDIISILAVIYVNKQVSDSPETYQSFLDFLQCLHSHQSKFLKRSKIISLSFVVFKAVVGVFFLWLTGFWLVTTLEGIFFSEMRWRRKIGAATTTKSSAA